MQLLFPPAYPPCLTPGRQFHTFFFPLKPLLPSSPIWSLSWLTLSSTSLKMEAISPSSNPNTASPYLLAETQPSIWFLEVPNSVVLLGQPLHLRTGFHPLICSRELLSTIFFLFTLDHQFFPVCGLISCWNFSFKNSVLKKKKKILSWPHTLAPSYHPVSLTLMIAELLTRVPSLSLILLFTFSLEPTPIRILHPTPLWNLHSTKSSGHLSCLMSLEFSAASRRVDEALFYEALSLLPGLLTADFLPS